MSSVCPGSQLEVLYSQIKVAIFQPCERRARPQMETSFSGGLCMIFTMSSRALKLWCNNDCDSCASLQVTWKNEFVTNLRGFQNSLEDLSRFSGFNCSMFGVNQFLAPERTLRLFDGPHSLPSQWARHGQPPKDPWGGRVVFTDGSTSIKPIKSKMWSANFIMTHIPRPFIKHAKFSGATRYAFWWLRAYRPQIWNPWKIQVR